MCVMGTLFAVCGERRVREDWAVQMELGEKANMRNRMKLHKLMFQQAKIKKQNTTCKVISNMVQFIILENVSQQTKEKSKQHTTEQTKHFTHLKMSLKSQPAAP